MATTDGFARKQLSALNRLGVEKVVADSAWNADGSKIAAFAVTTGTGNDDMIYIFDLAP